MSLTELMAAIERVRAENARPPHRIAIHPKVFRMLMPPECWTNWPRYWQRRAEWARRRRNRMVPA